MLVRLLMLMLLFAVPSPAFADEGGSVTAAQLELPSDAADDEPADAETAETSDSEETDDSILFGDEIPLLPWAPHGTIDSASSPSLTEVGRLLRPPRR